jgi:hypothetical protein
MAITPKEKPVVRAPRSYNAGGRSPQGTAIHALEDCHIDSINRHDRSITLRHGDELDVGRLNYGPVLLQTDAAMAALGATTLPVLTP